MIVYIVFWRFRGAFFVLIEHFETILKKSFHPIKGKKRATI